VHVLDREPPFGGALAVLANRHDRSQLRDRSHLARLVDAREAPGAMADDAGARFVIRGHGPGMTSSMTIGGWQPTDRFACSPPCPFAARKRPQQGCVHFVTKYFKR
jgi:hypothetical protein